MTAGRMISVVGLAAVVLASSGCVSQDQHRQLLMAQRNLESEKASLEQELYDTRVVSDTLRSRVMSLEDQIGAKNQLVDNLQSENDGLEEKFHTAQSVLEKIADRPIGAVRLGAGRLPAELDAALSRLAAQDPSIVVYDSENGMLKWSANLVFALGSDVVRESATGMLRRFGEIIGSPVASDFDLVVVGHTDNIPIRKAETLEKHSTNRHLAVHRAIAVASLLQNYGVDPSRVGVMGYGEYRPVAPNDDEASRAKNRRVEMYIVPRGTFSAGADARSAMSFTGEKQDDPTK